MRLVKTLAVSMLLLPAFVGCATHTGGMSSLLPASFAKKSSGAQFQRELSMARLQERHGQMGTAAAVYRKVIKADPENVVAHHRMGVIAARDDRFEDALKHLNQAVSNGEPSAEMMADLGYVHYLREDYTSANQCLQESIRLDPAYKPARNNLGLVLARQGKMKESFAQFRKATSEAGAYANLAFVQSQMGHLADAEANYHKALERDSNLKQAANGLLQVASKTGTLQRSLAPLKDRTMIAKKSSTPPARQKAEPVKATKIAQAAAHLSLDDAKSDSKVQQAQAVQKIRALPPVKSETSKPAAKATGSNRSASIGTTAPALENAAADAAKGGLPAYSKNFINGYSFDRNGPTAQKAPAGGSIGD